MTKIVIIGGGIAGCTTALELAKNNPEAQIIILEQAQEILQGTSARTPGRMGLGYHYFDAQTAKTYMQHTIGFMKKYSDCFVGEESTPHLQSGRYFIVKDSILPPDEVLAGYEKISSHFQEICAKDESNNIFQTQRLHEMLDSSQFEGGVDPKKIAYAIQTKERLLDWKKFDSRIKAELAQHQNIQIRTNFKVDKVSPRQGGGFIFPDSVEGDYVVNCTWQNIEQLNQKLGLGDAHFKKENPKESATARLKLLVEVALPQKLERAHSMFFCFGEHAMFSNLGNGIGRITYAPVTNFGTTTESEMPAQWQKWLAKGLSAEEQQKYGQKIIDGVSLYIPAMADAKVNGVIAGIVKSKGEVELSNPNSSFHKRAYSGVEEQQIGWIDNAAMKLFYCLDNAKEVAEIIQNQEQVSPVLDAAAKSIANQLPEKTKKIAEDFFQFHLRRNFSSNLILPEITQQAEKKSQLQDEVKESRIDKLKKTPPQKTYRLICVLDSVSQGDVTLSKLDASPDYLHIHALDSEILPSISEFKKTLPPQSENIPNSIEDPDFNKNQKSVADKTIHSPWSNSKLSKLDDKSNLINHNTLTQWGIPLELATKSRSPKVSSQEIKQRGQIGIGSAARGDEQSGNFIGGGEGFLFGSQNFRITKGGEAFLVGDEENFWTFQVADFAGAKAISDSVGQEILGRQKLLEMLKEKSGGKPFVAVFDADLHEGSFVRSNGIFPEDDVDRKSESTFDAKKDQTRGGHLVGGSTNKGDLLSLREKFGDEEQAAANDFGLTIKSKILLKAVDELVIARSAKSQALEVIEKDDRNLKEENIQKISGFKRPFDEPAIAESAKKEFSLEKPRTEIQVREAEAAIKITNFLKEKSGKIY